MHISSLVVIRYQVSHIWQDSLKRERESSVTLLCLALSYKEGSFQRLIFLDLIIILKEKKMRNMLVYLDLISVQISQGQSIDLHNISCDWKARLSLPWWEFPSPADIDWREKDVPMLELSKSPLFTLGLTLVGNL